MHISIIILNWNGKENILSCLSSLSKIKQGNYSLATIIVDNASVDGSIEAIEEAYPEVMILKNKENVGFSQGNNVGIDYALSNSADAVVILNNDTLVDEKLISTLVETAFSKESIGIVAPKIYFAKGYEFHKDRYSEKDKGKVFWYAGGIMDWNNVIGSHRGVDEVDIGQYDQKEITDFASGCCMLIKREVFEKIGMLDNKYFLYYEDADFCERTKQAGFTILYQPKAVLWHKNAGSAGGSGSMLQDYYITRNRLLFGMRYSSIRAKAALARESIKMLVSGRKWQKKGAVDFYLQKFEKGSYR